MLYVNIPFFFCVVFLVVSFFIYYFFFIYADIPILALVYAGMPVVVYAGMPCQVCWYAIDLCHMPVCQVLVCLV